MGSTPFEIGTTIHGFAVERVESIPELRSTARIVRHAKTGARLIHLLNDDTDNLFCCGFRTPVFDSTGVPHILEHSVLGGSRKFPVKDPFQQLLKCSLQTFLNAMTYPDKTLYPVGSQVEKDFYNLVDVYCDAVFHPLLTENTFYQEGWHFDVEDPSKPVGIKGIVYNEMKGVFSNFSSHVARRTLSELYPDTTYFYESGGDPEHITDLTYERFRDFHAKYYHPSNAYIFLYGNLPTERTLAFLDGKYLSGFERIETTSEVAPQPLWGEPRAIELEAPAAKEDEGTATVNVCWIVGNSTDPVRMLAGLVLSRYLLGTESSPLRRALIDSKLGEDLDEMCGFESDLVQALFVAGLRKTKAKHAETIRSLVFDTLRQQVETGLDQDLLEGTLRQTEFALREITSRGRAPYGLMLADRCYRSWIYDGDPLCHLAFERIIAAVRNDRGSPQAFFEQIIREALLDNPHHLTATVRASPSMGEELSHLTARQARKLSVGFTADDVARCHEVTTALVEEQKKPPSAEDLAALPRVGKDDLPLRNVQVPVERTDLEGVPVFAHSIFSGGIAYCDIGFDCGAVPDDLISYLPLYCELSTRCGAAGLSYEHMAKRISLATGGMSAGVSVGEHTDSSTAPMFRVFYHGKCLEQRFDEMLGILRDLFLEPKLDDRKLIADIVLEMRNDMNSSAVSAGNAFAALRAASRLNATRRLSERLDGVEQLRFLDGLARRNDPAGVGTQLQALHRALIVRQGALLSLTADSPASCYGSCSSLLGELPAGKPAAGALPDIPDTAVPACGIEISSSINFVAKAWRMTPQDSTGLGLLSLLGTNLSRGYLWDKVRVEGGAYGCSAATSGLSPVFACSSYRDPNLTRTLQTFDNALTYAATQVGTANVDESIVSTIGQMDKPKAPHAKGFSETMALLLGRTPEYRQQIRGSVLSATAGKVHKKAREILESKSTAVCILGSAGAFDAAAKEGVGLEREKLLGDTANGRA